MRDAICKQIVNQSARGRHAMTKLLMQLLSSYPDSEPNEKDVKKSFEQFARTLNEIAAQKAAKTPDKFEI